MYDFIIVGAGFFGSICAHELTKKGFKCLVLDKRNHIGGNAYTDKKEGIHIHKYGSHIFHTNSEKIWNYVSRFCTFNNFVNRLKVTYENRIYSFPINLLTLHQVFGVENPTEASAAIRKDIETYKKDLSESNFENFVIKTCGPTLYKMFFYGYTKKHWNTEPSELPASIAKRLPYRLNFDDNYYDHRFQGIPIGGYTQIFEKLLEGIEVRTGVDFFENKQHWEAVGKKIIYSGPIDKLLDYSHGKLAYRGLRHKEEYWSVNDYQGNAVMNYTSEKIPFTRIYEHKHFDLQNMDFDYTIITKEYPEEYGEKSEPFYPINDQSNNSIYKKYSDQISYNKKYVVGGRLGSYRYYDMDQVVASALKVVRNLECS